MPTAKLLRGARHALALALLSVLAPAQAADAYPSRPITLIVPFAAAAAPMWWRA